MLRGKIETRTWGTAYRGKVLLCASKAPYSKKQLLEISGPAQVARIENLLGGSPDRKLSGVAFAVADLVDCRIMERTDQDATFVHYKRYKPLFCHVYQNVRRIKPFPVKGKQGWGIASKEDIAAIEYIDEPEPER